MGKEFLVSNEKDVLGNSFTFDERAKMLNNMKEEEEKAKELAKKSPFKDFAQLNRKNISHIIKGMDNPSAMKMLFFIMEHMDKMNALVCSYAVFMEQLSMSKSSVQRSIKYLKENGFIAIYKSGTANVYVMNDDLVWTTSGNKRMYSKFPANVILSLADQEEEVKKKLKFDHVKVVENKENEED